MENQSLPTINELYGEIDHVASQNKFNILLNQPPQKSWLKKHPTAPNVVYIPIERIEYLMTRIFIKWRVEIKSVSQLANSVVVTVRVHYMDRVTKEWDWQDGIGAAPLQTDKDAGAIDWNHIKTSAVQIGAPAAESYAFKDACEKLGKLFGKDMNRKDTMNYDKLENIFSPQKEDLKKQLEILLKDCQDMDIVEEVLNAKAEGKDTEEFYSKLIAKIKGQSNDSNPGNAQEETGQLKFD